MPEATNGQEALDLFERHKPDVTLMDFQMPVMNGIEAILSIRRDHPNAKFVVLTYSGDVQALLRKGLIETIRTVHSGRRRIPPEIAQAWRTTWMRIAFRSAKLRCCAAWPPAAQTRSPPPNSISLRIPSRVI
jgi:chemotaxis response regulator CheB